MLQTVRIITEELFDGLAFDRANGPHGGCSDFALSGAQYFAAYMALSLAEVVSVDPNRVTDASKMAPGGPAAPPPLPNTKWCR